MAKEGRGMLPFSSPRHTISIT